MLKKTNPMIQCKGLLGTEERTVQKALLSHWFANLENCSHISKTKIPEPEWFREGQDER